MSLLNGEMYGMWYKKLSQAPSTINRVVFPHTPLVKTLCHCCQQALTPGRARDFTTAMASGCSYTKWHQLLRG